MKDEQVKEVIVERKTGFSIKEVIIIMVITLVFGALIGSFVNFKRNKTATATIPKNLDEFLITYNRLTSDYYETIDKEKLTSAAIKGMIEYLDDPYTVYMEDEVSESFSQTVDGEYYGIGALITRSDNKVIVASILKSSPAEKAGLKPGDQIVNVDGVDVTADMAISDVTDKMKSSSNDKTTLKIVRDDSEMIIELVKSNIDIPSVYSEVIEKDNKKVGYIDISVFASNTYNQFIEELKKIEENNLDSLIIDVRSNPGGHLTQVSKILTLFVDKNKVLYQIKSKGEIEKIYSTNKNPKEYSLIVLVNNNSASASEILAATLKESANALLIGNKTYGKGTVQKAYSLSNGAIVKYTSEEWLTPNGKSINKEGIMPDIEVELSTQFYELPTKDNDNQLQTALEEAVK